jgi:hypothetical protein
MKYLFIFLLCLSLGDSACRKSKNTDNNDCTAVTITQSGTVCGNWGIKANGITYPSNNIPSQFQQEGITVCASYDLYEDMRACACCGGTWANIKSMKNFVR